MDSSLRSSSSRTSRFRFRDHHEMENSPQSESSSDISSLSSEREDEAELQSMTGKGIERLCTELLELKAASEEDFQGSIFSNYSVFVGIFAEVESIANEVVQLKKKVLTHKGLLNDLDGIYLKFLSDETIESTMEEVALGDEQSSLNELEAHISNVSETLDIHLSENRIDEAIAVLEMEEESSQKMQFEDDFPPDVLDSYASAISEKRAMLTLQLTLVAENPRTAAAEFQKVLSGLCRLGSSHLATQLLTNYYHSRIATGIRDVDCSNSLLHGQYIRELAKFVFSMISQAARSFVMLYGETRPFASELIQWVSEEIELFASSFNNYVTSISEISGGLAKAAEAVQIAVSYCSLLESQRLVLCPYLVKHILPCMEEVLQKHIEHFKKVIGICAATDAWVLGRYLVSGRMKGWCPSTVIGEQSEYCLLTNSGRKFVTVLQTITEDVAPLFTLQMEGSVVGGLVDLFMEYIVILERAITHETNGMEKGGSRINLAKSLQQQVSVLANLSTLKHFFSNLVSTIFGEINCVDPEQNKIQSNGIQDPELESCITCLHDASTQLRAHFFHQFINKLMSLETGRIPGVENCNESQGDHDGFHGVMPSVPFQVLFLELRKLCKLAEENVFEMDWLIELLRELIEAILVWTKINKEMWANTGKNSASHHSDSSHQFILDMHFLMEIARFGRYFFGNPLTPSMLMESAFASVGLDTDRDVDDDDWAINIATEAIQRLLEIEKTNATLNDDPLSTSEEEIENEFESAGDSVHEFESSGHTVSEESFESKEDARATYASEVTLSSKTSISSLYFSPRGSSLDLENKGYSTHRSATNSSDTYGDPEGIESEDDKCS